MDTTRLHILLQRYMDQSATKEEEIELMNFVADPAQEDTMKNLLASGWEQWQVQQMLSEDRSRELYHWIKQRMLPQPDSVFRKVIMLNWRRVAAAAAVLVLIGTMVYLKMNIFKNNNSSVVATKAGVPDVMPPATTNAILTLANGTQIVLASAHKGMLISQGSVNIMKVDKGKLAYSPLTTHNGQPATVQYNTLTVPRGSKIAELTLSDGSKVWLNVASSIHFPVVFTGAEREVEITGEVYFEIAHDATKPFIVRKGETSIEVLGTHFNVSAYDNEPDMKVTLLQGSVKVKSQKSQLIITPGEQAVVTSEGHLGINKNADIGEVIAWRNGKFYFNNADLATVMRQISRWYDVEVVYRGKTDFHFGGQLSRNSSLAEIFKILEISGVRFTIDGKKVTVLP